MKKFEDMTKDELIQLVKKTKEQKKYGLVWEEKPEELVDQCNLELPVLVEISEKAVTKDSSLPVNYVIEGDNYHALSVLNYTHERGIDLIYIDPPYNTGARDWKYNNHFVDIVDTYGNHPLK